MADVDLTVQVQPEVNGMDAVDKIISQLEKYSAKPYVIDIQVNSTGAGQQVKELIGQLKNIKKNYSNLNIFGSKGGSGGRSKDPVKEALDSVAVVEKLDKKLYEYQSTLTKAGGAGISQSTREVEQLGKTIRSLEHARNELANGPKDAQKNAKDIEKLLKSGSKYSREVQSMTDANKELEKSFEFKDIDSGLEKIASKLKTSRNTLSQYAKKGVSEENESYQKYLNGIAQMEELSQKMRDPKSGLNLGDASAKYKEIARSILDATLELDKFVQTQEQAKNAQQVMAKGTDEYAKGLNEIAKAQAKADKLLGYTAAKNGRSAGAYQDVVLQADALKQLEAKYKTTGMSAKQFQEEISNIKQSLKGSEQTILANGEGISKFGADVRGGLASFGRVLGQIVTVQRVISQVKQMVQASMDIESAMTRIQIVTGSTDAQMNKFFDSVTGQAKDLGKSVTDVAGSIETFSRLGYNLEEATGLSKYANIMANVGDVSVSEATTGMTSIIKGFGLLPKDAEHVSDVLINVGQKYAISASELMTAFERGGASMNAANTSFEQSAALFAATNAALQNSFKTGTLWNTVSARIRSATSELEEMGESTEDLDGGFSKYRDELLARTGVDIQDAVGNYRSMYDIFVDIAEVWDDMADEQSQSRVAEILGGTRNRAGIMSTIQNIADAKNAFIDAVNSENVAINANNKYMDTAAAHLGQFKAAWQDLSYDLFDSGTTKGFIDFGSKVVNVLDGMTNAFGSLGTLVAGGAVAKTIGTVFKSMTKDGKSFVDAWKDVSIPGLAIAGVITAISAIYTQYQKVQQEQHQNAAEGAQIYKDQADALKDYADRMIDLRTKLSEGTLSDTEAYNAKKELLDIQNQLNESYSTGTENINLLNGRMEEQAKIILALEKQDAQRFLNANGYGVKGSGLDDAIKAMEGGLKDFDVFGTFITDSDLGKRIAEIVKDYNGLFELENVSYGLGFGVEGVQSQLKYVGSIYEADEAINNMLTSLKGLNEEFKDPASAEFLQNLIERGTDGLTEANAIIAENGEIYARYRESMLTTDENIYDLSRHRDAQTAAEWIHDYAKAIDDVNQAYISGDDEALKSAIANYKSLDEIMQNSTAPGGPLEIYSDMINDLGDAILETALNQETLFKIERATSGKSSEQWAESFKIASDKLKEYNVTTGEFLNAYTKYKEAMEDGSLSGSPIHAQQLESGLQGIAATLVKRAIEGEIIDDDSFESIEKLAEYLLQDNALLDETANTVDKANKSFTEFADYQSDLKSAMEASNSVTGLTEDNIKKLTDAYAELESFDPEKLFENTAHGVKLNREELKKLDNEIRNSKLDELYEKRAQKEAQIKEAERRTGETKQLKADVAAIDRDIAKYEGATSAYSGWVNAKSLSKYSDAWATIYSGYEEMSKLALEEGRVGNDAVNEFLNTLLGENRADTGNIFSDVMADFKALNKTIEGTNHSLLDYFNPGDTGFDGLRLFLDDVNKLLGDDFAKIDASGGYTFDFTGDKLDQLMSRMKLTVDDVQLLTSAFQEFGNYLPGTMASTTKQAQKSLKQFSEYQENLKSAIETSDSKTGLSTDQIDNLTKAYKNLESYNPSKLFKNTAHGVELNTDELKRLNDEVKSNKLSELYSQLKSQQEARDSIVSHMGRTEGIDEDIRNTEMLISQFEGTISAYNEWSNTRFIENFSKYQSDLQSAIEASNSETGLSIDQIKSLTNAYEDLEGFDPSRLFKNTADGVKLDNDELQRLNDTVKKNKLSELYSQLSDQLAERRRLRDEGGDTSSVQGEIDATNQLIAQYQGMISAYEEWINAKPLEQFSEYQSNLIAAMNDSASATGVTTDEIKGLKSAYQDLIDGGYIDDYDFNRLFEATANGIHLNRRELNNLNNLLEKKTMADYAEQISDAAKEYNALLDAQKRGAIVSDEELSNALNRINSLKAQESQYEGMISAFNKWQQSQSIADERANYAAVGEGYEGIKELVENGWINDAEVGAYLDLVLGKVDAIGNVAKRSGDNLADFAKLTETNAYGHNIIGDYWSYGENGQLNPLGLETFLQDVNAFDSDIVSMQETADGTSYSINMLGDNLARVSQEFGLSAEMIHLMEKAMLDAGADMIFDSTNLGLMGDQVEKLSQKSETLSELLAEYDWSNVESWDSETTQKAIESLKDGMEEVGQATKEAKQQYDLMQTTVEALQRNELKNALREQVASGKSYDELREITKSGNLTATIGIEADASQAQSVIDELEAEAEATTITVTIDEGQFSQLIGEGEEKQVNVSYSITEQPDEPTYEDQNPQVTYSETHPEAPFYPPQNPHVTYHVSAPPPPNFPNMHRTVTYKVSVIGGIGKLASGTMTSIGVAHADGSMANAPWNWKHAYANGKVALDENELALVNELGTESIIRNGQWMMLPGGMHMEALKKGDIILSADQTKALLNTGKASGHGHAYALGTVISNAYANPISSMWKGVAGMFSTAQSFINKNKYSSANTSSGGSKGGGGGGGGGDKSDSNDNEDEPDKMDWIELAIDRIERAIKRLGITAKSTFQTLTTRLKATADEIVVVTDEIELQQKAYDRYIKEAESVGLSEDLAKKVRDGTIDINEYDKDTKKLIDDYKEWYEKALDCSDAIEQLREDLAELYEDRFKDTKDDFDSQLDLLKHLTTTYENGMDDIEARGYLATTKYYEAMRKVENQNIKIMNNELDALIEKMSQAVNSGSIKEGSQAWYDMQQEINGVKEAIQEAETSVIELGNKIREVLWDRFDYLQDRISQITDEGEFLMDLLSHSDMTTKTGLLTNEGLATMGLHAQNYDVYMNQADRYAAEVEKLNKELANDPNNTIILEQRQEWIEAQRESILNAEEEKEAMINLVEEGMQAELNALNELINRYKESIDSAKNLYDYQKKVAEQSQKISSIQKQLRAYAGDDSEETRAITQKLTVDLSDAMEKLEETQYQKQVSDQKQMLSNLYDAYELVLNQRLDNVDALMADLIQMVNLNSGTTQASIEALKEANGGYVNVINGQISYIGGINSSWYNTLNGTTLGVQNGVAIGANSIMANENAGYSSIKDVLATSAGNISNANTAGYQSIKDALNYAAIDVGYTISDEMKSIWSDNGNANRVVAFYGDLMNSGLGTTNGKLDTVNSIIAGIAANVASMVKTSDNKASTTVSSTTSSTATNTAAKPVTQTPTTPAKPAAAAAAPAGRTQDEKYGVAIAIWNGTLGWGAGQDRKNKLTAKGFNYDEIQRIVNEVKPAVLDGTWQKKYGITDLTKYAYNKFKSGGLVDYTGIAQVDGTPGKPEAFLNAEDTKNLTILKDTLRNIMRGRASLSGSSASLGLFAGLTGVSRPQGLRASTVGDITYQINIPIDHVTDYDDFVNKMRNDTKFERLIQSMTIDQLAGQSSIAKNKYKW